MSSPFDPTASAPPDGMEALRRDLDVPIARLLGSTATLQQQAEDLAQETYLPDLQKIQLSGRQLNEVVHELTGVPSAATLEDIDFPRLRFEICSALNHTLGYLEMLQERAVELNQPALRPELEKALAACQQLAQFATTAGLHTDAPTPVAPPEGLTVPASAAEDASRKPATILVVDDNLQNRELLGRQLRGQGFRVVPAGSGPSAMERLRAETFDLILLDVVMPGMNGYEVLQWLKADTRLRHIPVIMISATNDTEHVVRCLVIGADDYVAKPFDPILLKTRLAFSLERARWRQKEESYQRQIEEERARSERILLNILPHSTVTPG